MSIDVCTMKTLEEIDAMTLRQALVVADDWVEELAFLEEVDKQVQEASTMIPRKPRRPKLDSKARRRRQLKELRAQVQSLETTLTLLRTNVQRPSEMTAVQRLYERVVDRESRARLQAQTYNLHLRQLVDELSRDAHKIQVLGRRMLALYRSHSLTLQPRSVLSSFREDPQLQLLRLPQLQAESNRIFDHAGFVERLGNVPIHQRLELRDVSGANGVVQVVFDCAWVLPFSMDHVAEAVWKTTTRIETGSNQPTKWKDIDANASSLVSQFTYAHDSHQFFKRGQIATTRETLDNGAIQFVSTIHVEAMENTTVVGTFQSDLWTHLVPLPTTSGVPLTQILWSRRRRLEILPSQNQTPVGRARWKHNTISGPIQDHEEKLLARNQQSLENYLVTRRK